MEVVSIKLFIEKFCEHNPDMPGEQIEAVLMRLFDKTIQPQKPYEDYVLYEKYLEYYCANGKKKMKAIADVSIDFNRSEKSIRYIIEKYEPISRNRAC